MGTIRIEIVKNTDTNDASIFVSFPHHCGVRETTRFAHALQDAIETATRWQTGNKFVPAPDPPKEVPAKSEDLEKGSKAGRARAEKLSPERRSEIAKAAAAKRWGATNAAKESAAMTTYIMSRGTAERSG